MLQYVTLKINSRRNIISAIKNLPNYCNIISLKKITYENYKGKYHIIETIGNSSPPADSALLHYPLLDLYENMLNTTQYDDILNVDPLAFNAETTCKKLNLPFIHFVYLYYYNTNNNTFNESYRQPMYYVYNNISDYIYINSYIDESVYVDLIAEDITNNNVISTVLDSLKVTEYPCSISDISTGGLELNNSYYYEFLDTNINSIKLCDKTENVIALFRKLLYRIHVYSSANPSSYEYTLYGIPYFESNTNPYHLRIAIPDIFNYNLQREISNKYIRIETPEFVEYYMDMVSIETPPATVVEKAPSIHGLYVSEDEDKITVYLEHESSVLSNILDTDVNYISILPSINMFANGTYIINNTVKENVLEKRHRYTSIDTEEIPSTSINTYQCVNVDANTVPYNGTNKRVSYSNLVFKTRDNSNGNDVRLLITSSNLYSSSSYASATTIFIPHITHIEIISQEDSRLPQNEESSFYHSAEPYATILQPETMKIITYDDFRYNSNEIEYAKITTYVRDKYLQVYHPSWDTSWALHKQSYVLGAVEGISNISDHEIEDYPLRYSYSLLDDFLSSSVTSVSERLPDTDTIFLESHKFYCLQNIYNQNDPVQLHEINSWFTLNRKMEIDFRRSIRSDYDPEDKQYVISVSRYDFFYRPLKLSNIDNMVSIQKEWQEKDFAYGIYYTNDDMNEISLDITIPSSRVLDLTTYLNTDIPNIPLTDYKYVFFSKDFVTYQAPYFMAMLTSDSELSISDPITKEKMLELGITSTTSSNYNNQRIDTGLGYIRFRKAPSYTESLPDTVINIMSHTNYRTIDMNTVKDGFTGRTHLIENESIAKGRRYFIGVWYTLYPWRGYLSYNPLPNTKLLTFVTATRDASSITISVGNGEFDLGKQNTLNVESSAISTRVVIYLLDKYNEPETYTKLYEITTNNASVDLIDYIEQIYKDYNQQYTIDDTVQIPLLIDVIGNLGTKYVYNSVKLIVTFTLEGNLIYSKNVLVEGDDSNRRIYENKLYEMQAKTTTYPTEGSVTYNIVSENPVKAIAIEANTEEVSGTIDFYIVVDNKKYKIVPLNTGGGLPNILFVSPPEEIESYLKANYGDNCIIKIDKSLYTFDIEVNFKTNNQYYTPELSLLKALVSSDLTSFMGG